MPKVLWVALPLLAAAALLALHMLRRGTASRHALNVWSSLLLLGYVATTAGLGIFWVANQQLPVFDWHYLFGYATLLLVALHLVFNFGSVWRYLRRQRGALPAASDAIGAAPGRRVALGSLGLLLGAGVAFVLGLRHGRSELRIVAPMGRSPNSDPGDATGVRPSAAAALALVERFHAFSAHSRAGLLLRAPSVDWGDAPPAFKQIQGAHRVPLPAPDVVPGARIDRDTFSADATGPARGYRHAFLEAGLVGERVYLEAGARGLGACAVGAFYDEEAAALIGVDPAREWVVHRTPRARAAKSSRPRPSRAASPKPRRAASTSCRNRARG